MSSMMLGTLPGRPVVALDVDGTIAKYHQHFIQFAEQYLGRELTANWDEGFQGEFNMALGLDKQVYRDIKLAYRQGGMKRSIPLFKGAKDLVDVIHSAGAEVWFCTTRPWMRLDNIDPDTQHFFERHELFYNGIIYGEHKYADLAQIVGAERVVAVLEDLPEQYLEAEALGLNPILRTGSHNAWARNYSPEAWTVGSPGSAGTIQMICDRITDWHRFSSPAGRAIQEADGAPPLSEPALADRGEFGMPGVGGGFGAAIEGINKAMADASPEMEWHIPTDVVTPQGGINIAPSVIDADTSPQAIRVIGIMQMALELFLKKNRGYGDTAYGLGAKGQFADMNRKWGKLRAMLWDETVSMFPDSEQGEDVFQVLMDFIGHCALTIDFVRMDVEPKEEGR